MDLPWIVGITTAVAGVSFFVIGRKSRNDEVEKVKQTISTKDYQLVVATVVMATGLLVAGNFVADLLLAWSDPRIRLK